MLACWFGGLFRCVAAYDGKERIIKIGNFRLGFIKGDKSKWLEEFEKIKTFYYPGITEYQVTDPLNIDAKLTVVPLLSAYGMICKVEISSSEDCEVTLLWGSGIGENKEGKIFGEKSCKVLLSSTDMTKISGEYLILQDATLPRLKLLVGGSFTSPGSIYKPHFTEKASVFYSTTLRLSRNKSIIGYLIGLWGLTDYDEQAIDAAMRRIRNKHNLNVDWERKLRELWFDTYVAKTLQPEEKFKEALANAAMHYQSSIEYWVKRRNQLKIKTPNPKLDSLASFTTGISDYCYQPPGYYHNVDARDTSYHWTYIFSYRQWYANEVIGDHDQIEQTLRLYATHQGDPSDKLYEPIYGPLKADGYIYGMRENMEKVYCQTWNPSYIDQVYFHYCWTGDRDIVKDLWPTLKKAIQWQLDNLDHDKDGLFIARGNCEWWGSDFHWKGPKACLESAITWRSLKDLVELAEVVGDGQAKAEYTSLADKIKRRIFEELWSKERGVLCSKYYYGIKQEHPEAMEEYVPIWAGLMDEMESYMMLRFLTENLWVRSNKGFYYMFMNDWWPLVWSHHMVSPGEIAETCLAYFKAGRKDEGYALLIPVTDSVYRTDCPNFQPLITLKGEQDEIFQQDFGCSWGPFIRSIVEGLFGIEAQLQKDELIITPNFPSDWQYASIHIPDLEYTYEERNNEKTVTIVTHRPLVRKVRIGVNSRVEYVLINGIKREYKVEAGVNRCYMTIETAKEKESRIVLKTGDQPISVNYNPIAIINEPVTIKVDHAEEVELLSDPQEVIRDIEISGNLIKFYPDKLGNRTFFLKITQGNVTLLKPIDLTVKNGFEVASYVFNELEPSVTFTIKNNYSEVKGVKVKSTFAGEDEEQSISIKAKELSEIKHKLSPIALQRVSPGGNPLKVKITSDKREEEISINVITWSIFKNLPDLRDKINLNLILLDLKDCYNGNADGVLCKEYEYDDGVIGTGYHGYEPPPKLQIDRLQEDLVTEYSIPFRTGGRDGNNVIAIARWKPYNYPAAMCIPVNRKIDKVYLLLVSKVVPMKNYFPNARVVLRYEDGTEAAKYLTPPFSLDCYYQHFNLEGAPVELGLRLGFKITSHHYSTDYNILHADIIDMVASSQKKVKEIEIAVLCSECIIMLLGVTLVIAGNKRGNKKQRK
jgi:hypothetical protein